MKKICKCSVCSRFIPYYASSRATIMEMVYDKKGSREVPSDVVFLCSDCRKEIYSRARKKTKKHYGINLSSD